MIADQLADLAVSVQDLDSLPGNPRKGDVEAIMRSFQTFGQRKPLVARRNGDGRGVVIAGNHQLEAARRLGWAEVAVVWVDDDDATAKAFALADNRTSDLGTYDEAALLEMIGDVRADEELLAATAYSERELADLVARVAEKNPRPGFTDPDAVPEPPEEPVTRTGDVWRLGEHRVVCGDATEKEPVQSVLESVPSLVFADPPYGIAFQAMREGVSPIRNDDEGAEIVTERALGLVAEARVHFVCCNWRSLPSTLRAMSGAGLEPKACIVWDKGHPTQNLDRYGKQHEFILYAGPYGGQRTVAGDVWTVSRDYEPKHATPKPVALICKALETASESRDLIFDPFLGSGSTLIAAEQLDRRCVGVELEPRNVDVICRRYQEHTLDLPVLERTGEAVDFGQARSVA